MAHPTQQKKSENDRFDEIVWLIKQSMVSNEARFTRIDRQFEHVDKRFEKIDQRFEDVDKRFEKIEKQFEKIGERLFIIEQRLDGMDKRFTSVEERLNTLEEMLAELAEHQQILREQVNEIAARQDGLATQMSQTRDYLDRRIASLRGEIMSTMYAQDEKMTAGIRLLEGKKVFTTAETREILSMPPFPKAARG